MTDLYVTTEDGERAQIWPLGEWEKNEARLKKHSVGNRAVKKYLDMTGYHGQEVKMDAQGRFMLPQILRSRTKLEGDLAVIGKITHLEVVSRVKFEEALPARSSHGGRSQGGRWRYSAAESEDRKPLRGAA